MAHRVSCNECPYDYECHKYPESYSPYECPIENDEDDKQDN